MSRVLIVDDVAPLAEQYGYDLRRLGGHEVMTATNGPAALDALERSEIDCVLLDLEMPGIDGFEVLREIGHRGIDVPVIVYTGTGTFDRCMEAIRRGAATFIDKAEPMERVAQEVANTIERYRLRREVASLQRRLGESAIVGESQPIVRLRETLAKVAPVPSSVLILGESGTGKELVARELHRLGPHPSGPFVAINCGALPENLVESELFGHEKGAFTGAAGVRKGAFEVANGGTLFLDEIGELPLPAQAKLLRALEQREITRVGSTQPLRLEVRFVAATNRDLDEAVANGGFRSDLLYRLNVHTVRVPALREHREDVPLLAARFVEEICRRFGVLPKRLSGEVREALLRYDWRRNNVRELRNAIERMIVLADGETIRAEHLPPEVSGTGGQAEPRTFQDLKTEAERAIILGALERHDWQITKAADALGLADHASLLKIMRRLSIRRE